MPSSASRPAGAEPAQDGHRSTVPISAYCLCALGIALTNSEEADELMALLRREEDVLNGFLPHKLANFKHSIRILKQVSHKPKVSPLITSS